MDKIEEIHNSNLKLIKDFNLKKGDKLILNCDYNKFQRGDIFTIETINTFYGWICFKETEQLPQEVKMILSILNIIK